MDLLRLKDLGSRGLEFRVKGFMIKGLGVQGCRFAGLGFEGLELIIFRLLGFWASTRHWKAKGNSRFILVENS